MKYLILITLSVVCFFRPTMVEAQHRVMNTPGKYLMPMDNASAGFPGKGKEGDLWVAFSDRPDNVIYTDKACKTPSATKMKFMQGMYVIEEAANSVRLVALKDADFRGTLVEGAESRSGWVPKDNMLLWRTCLKTRDVNLPEFKDGIFNKKAMVLNILSNNQQSSRAPEYYSNPRCNPADSINSALVYQINYVYKETDNAYLLADIPQIVDVTRDAPLVKGWVLKNQTTAWNHRLALEVNWDDKAVVERKSKQKKAKIYSAKTVTGDAIYTEPSSYYYKRDIGEVDRFPVLDVYNGISKVGVIGDLRSDNGGTLSGHEFAQIKHVIDSMSGSLRNVNVIFVIDATSSMVPYSNAIQTAVKQTTRSLMGSANNFKFAALLYRDASEGLSNVLNKSRDLSSSYNGLTSLLSRNMTATFNRCNNDPEEAVFYGIKTAVEYFDPPAGESNYVILIGDCGNHNRTQVTDCSGKVSNDATNVQENELVDLLVKKNINLFAYQVHHMVTSDVKPAYDAFRTQVQSIMEKIAIKRTGASGDAKAGSILFKQNGIVEIKPEFGVPGYFKMAPDGGSVHQQVLQKDIENGFLLIDQKVNHELEAIAEYLNGKLKPENVKELGSFISKLESLNIPKEKLDFVFQKNGQAYNTGYVKRFEAGMKNPIFQDVLLMSREDLLSIKKSLERLIPTDERALSFNESRAFILYGWKEILVDILGYFPDNTNEALDTLSLYTLSAILTGWGGKEKYKDIRLEDVTQQDRFSDVELYEYLIDWCVTKGHIQSIFEGQNLLTEDFFEDHMWTIFYEYLIQLTNGEETEAPEMKEKFARYFAKYNNEYNNYKASFRIPMGTGSGLKHFWIDARIFPHDAGEFGEEDFIQFMYKDYNK